MSAESSQNETALVVTREVDSHQFGQRTSDGYFNATAMCQAVGKRVHDYLRRGKTKAFLDELASKTGIPVLDLAPTVRGGQPTWVYPLVAVNLASWLSTEFEVLVSGWVVEWSRQQGEREGAIKEWVSPDLHPWTLTFPPEFYSEIYRLKGWSGPIGPRRPSVIGHYTNDIVYARLAPGLLEMLRIKNPRQITGERQNRHHQWLTSHKGYPALKEHLRGVVILMGAFDSWDEFRVRLDRTLPVLTTQLSLFESQKAEMTLWE